YVLRQPTPTPTLLPYTTLFRSFTGGFHEVTDLRVALAYAAKDGDVTRRLRDFQVYHMKRTGVYEYFTNVEQPLIPVVVRMERAGDRKSTRLNSSHVKISYAVFC